MFTVCRPRKTNFCILFLLQQTNGSLPFLFSANKQKWQFSISSSCKQTCVVCLFVDAETNGSYPFANGLNGLNRLNGLNGLNRLKWTCPSMLFTHLSFRRTIPLTVWGISI
jgi:hypothetical protein